VYVVEKRKPAPDAPSQEESTMAKIKSGARATTSDAAASSV
jgi:hypothetical protein